MKKLRIIVTSVVVLAIVGSAFAFNAKKLSVFCRDTSVPKDGICDSSVGNFFIDPANGTTTIFYYQGWSGLRTECAGSHCSTAVLVSPNE